MHFPMCVVIHKHHLHSGVWKQRESFRCEASSAARGNRFQVKFLAIWICPYRNYRFSFTQLRLDILVCSLHSNLEPSFPLPTGISWWKCWEGALMHVSTRYPPLFRWNSACVEFLHLSPYYFLFHTLRCTQMFIKTQIHTTTQTDAQSWWTKTDSFLWHTYTHFIYRLFLSHRHTNSHRGKNIHISTRKDKSLASSFTHRYTFCLVEKHTNAHRNKNTQAKTLEELVSTRSSYTSTKARQISKFVGLIIAKIF